MSVNWTKEQNDAICKKGSNILVAAAAGSGKTAVLVERIIRKIIDDKVDIDKIVVVTFTSAAASEMRERILEAIYKKIEDNPEDENMQRQINLLNKASICTIDSFCLDIIKNNFFNTDISANFRVADSTEIDLLKQETIDDIFEEKYINNEEDFLELIDTYTKYNRDEDLQELVLKIYNYIQSSPFPEDWLNEKINMFKDYDSSNFSLTPWGKEIISYAQEIIENCILKLGTMLKKMRLFSELDKFSNILIQDIDGLKIVMDNLKNWDYATELATDIFDRWPSDKKVVNELKNEAKELRDSVKKEFDKVKELLPYNTCKANEDIDYAYLILNKLRNLVLEFGAKFYIKKREKNIIDFNDMEHLALKLLVEKSSDGSIIKTDVAKNYANKFEEIAIDEYQDSNLVQELILTSVSRGDNIFMVGDVKQSIYKFRQARPELFLEKYQNYKLEPTTGEDRKIQLFKNFRSRENILDFTNIIFKNIMSYELGKIDYSEAEYLNLGANYTGVTNQDLKTEINIIDLKEPEDDIWQNKEPDNDNGQYDDDEIEDDGEDKEEHIENVILEARFVAQRIKKLIDNKYQVVDKNKSKNGEIKYRSIKAKDIAVLLRSANSVAPVYEKEISQLGITVYTDNSNGYLQSIEIDTMLSLFKIINNPMQDIPLVAVLRSSIGNFTDNELLEISFAGNKLSFYEKMQKTIENSKNEELVNKIQKLFNNLQKWREEEKYKPLDELIWNIYIDTGYMDYVSLMPNGELRLANLKMLFEKAKKYESASFKGLYNFINFIDRIKNNNNDMSSAKIIGENENVVRIMSIHKSKGLEFPVIILAGTGKNFNYQDFKEKIILHQDLGIGPQYIDAKRRIEFKTLAKAAIEIKAKQELVAEEMRVLYVALTRAKEKLIITGLQKDVSKSIKEKESIIEIYNDNKEKINPFVVQRYKNYLDWIELVVAKENNEKVKNITKINIISKDNLVKSIQENSDIKELSIEKEIKEKADGIGKNNESIEELLSWKYNFKGLENVPTNMSVSKLKKLMNEIAIDEINITEKPKFANENGSKLSAAEKGTAMHLCVQKLDSQKEYTENDIKNLLQKLVQKEIMTQQAVDSIDISAILNYTKSNLWNELKKAKEIHKEQPFFINIPIKEIYKMENNADNILVQGIIDLYYINKNDELILVDYKTDYVETGKEHNLVDKYKVQLEVYKNALEESVNRKVDKVEIYSLYLNKELTIE